MQGHRDVKRTMPTKTHLTPSNVEAPRYVPLMPETSVRRSVFNLHMFTQFPPQFKMRLWRETRAHSVRHPGCQKHQLHGPAPAFLDRQTSKFIALIRESKAKSECLF